LVHNGGRTAPDKEDALVTENESPASRRFTALTNRHMMAFYAVRKLTERNRDTANHAVESARLGVREWSDVGRRWMKQPADIAGLLRNAAEVTANARARSAALFQEWLDGVRDLRR
jgi:hypothetical protein